MLNKDTGVLIIEDNEQYASLLQKILQKQCGLENIKTVPDTETAFKALKDNPDEFNLLFVDFHFPQGKTGGDLLERLRDEQLLGNKAAFLITAEPDSDNVKQAQAAGVIGVLAKPFEIKQIQKLLDKAKRYLDIDDADSFVI